MCYDPIFVVAAKEDIRLSAYDAFRSLFANNVADLRDQLVGGILRQTCGRLARPAVAYSRRARESDYRDLFHDFIRYVAFMERRARERTGEDC